MTPLKPPGRTSPPASVPRARSAAKSASASRLRELRARLKALGSPEDARVLQRFFKTGPGQYGEGDVFLGVRVPAVRRLAAEADGLTLPDWLELLASPLHEERLLALVGMARRFQRGGEGERKAVYHAYLDHRAGINNWDLVDISAPCIPGAWLLDRPRGILHRLARSPLLWDRRIAVVSTFAFIRAGDLADTFRLCEALLGDTHDLMHKACGWALRECGKRDLAALRAFLDRHTPAMPRTMLRYAIEKMTPAERALWMTR